MTTYYIDSAASGANNGTSWTDAYQTTKAAFDAITLADGDIVYIDDAHTDSSSYSADYTITGPSSGNARIISVDHTSGEVETAGSNNQINTTSSYDLILTANLSLHSVKISCATLSMVPSGEDTVLVDGCYVQTSDAVYCFQQNTGTGRKIFKNSTLDMGGITRTSRNVIYNRYGKVYFKNNLITNVGTFNTGFIVDVDVYSKIDVSGNDFSALPTNVTAIANAGNSSVILNFHNNLMPSGWSGTPIEAQTVTPVDILFSNNEDTNSPWQFHYASVYGQMIATDQIYRSGGATLESTNVAWLVTTTADTRENCPLWSPWIYGYTTAGTKTFDLYMVNDSADFDDDEVWLEVEYLEDSTECEFGTASDRRALQTTTPAAQTDDTSSTWNGTGPSFTYKQKLSVASVSVGQAGIYRARVVIGKASIASSAYFYIDPTIAVS